MIDTVDKFKKPVDIVLKPLEVTIKSGRELIKFSNPKSLPRTYEGKENIWKVHASTNASVACFKVFSVSFLLVKEHGDF